MKTIVLIILLLPLLSFLLLLAGRKWTSKGLVAGIAILTSYGSFHLSSYLLLEMLRTKQHIVASIPWLTFADTVIRLGMEVKPLNVMMLVLVSLVSCLVQLYSWGYMRNDERFPVFFAYLGLFTFSMLGLVISSNLLQIYIFWELVGMCSFLLIGFWYHLPKAKAAAKKAFLVTRVGDVGLFIAIMLVFWQIGSFELAKLSQAVQTGTISGWMITLIAICIFIGAVGKSGQFPLHTWLPDAMEGPTPVSALIHAATMVAAGVYLVAVTYPVFVASPMAMDVIAYVGGFTALFAALIALAQHDIKRVLAYSTVSQLGYMMLALGATGYSSGVFHLLTHGFFKALLFLAAGAVIFSLHHEQDLRKMGGLWGRQKILGIWFLVGCFSLVGIPPFSGFFSKDEILLSVYADGRIGLFVIAVITAFLTAFYIFRLFYLVFAGTYRGENKVGSVPKVMIVPIVILGFCSMIAGFLQYPQTLFESFIRSGNTFPSLVHTTPMWIPWLTVIVSLCGLGLATMMYGNGRWSPIWVTKRVKWLHRLVERKFYIDELYHTLFALPIKAFGYVLSGVDRFVIGGLVRFVSKVLVMLSRMLSYLQNGQTQTYAVVGVIGLLILIFSLTAGRLLL